jgi:hypothetical protein
VLKQQGQDFRFGCITIPAHAANKRPWSMSALGQKQTSAEPRGMCASFPVERALDEISPVLTRSRLHKKRFAYRNRNVALEKI